MYLVLFQIYKQQHLIKPPSTYVTKSWLFHWMSTISSDGKKKNTVLGGFTLLRFWWTSSYLFFFLSQLSPFIKFLNENMLPKKICSILTALLFCKKKVSWKLFIKDKQQFYKISNSSLYQKGISVLMTMKQVTGKASGTILWYSSEIKNQLD